MDPDLLNELQLLCRDAYEASQSGEIASLTLLQKYVAHFNSIWRKCSTGQSIADTVREWVSSGQGRFFSHQMFTELGITAPKDKKAADTALRRLAEKDIITGCGEQRGCWRTVTEAMEEIDWLSAMPDDTIPVTWPLGLEQYFTLYPTNVIVIAGEKNAGKSSFCLNLCYLNALKLDMPIVYFSSEMAAQELAVRLRLFPDTNPFKKVKFRYLDYDAVVDVIEPDSINIVDFLEVEDEFWKVGKKIRKMWEKLRRGIIVVALQKDPDSKLGRGKAFSSEKARVYLTMTKKQHMTLTEVKNYKGDRKPDGMIIPYQFGNQAILERKSISAPPPKSNGNKVVPIHK